MSFVFLATGGAIGAISRYLLGLVMMKRYPTPPFPIAMLLVNITGSLGLGAFFSLYYGEIPLGSYKDSLYLVVGIGFFGAFTTFSTFSVESMQLLNQKEWKKFVAYILLSTVGSILFFIVGFHIFSLLNGISIIGNLP